MYPRRPSLVCAWSLVVCLAAAPLVARGDDFDREPINYRSSTPDNVITRLQKQLDDGKVRLTFDEHTGYARSMLKVLNVPESSQVLVFSKTSLQRHRISPQTPRALYFNDDIYLGFCQKGDVVEISAVDPVLGTVFYSLDQKETDRPKFVRQTDNCLLCHGSSQTMGVPGHVIRSVYPDPRGLPILSGGSHRVDQTTPVDKRWGGWYVTGTHGTGTHLGNLIIRGREVPDRIDNAAGLNVVDLTKRFDTDSYPTKHSDIVALMVMEHQADMHNLLTKANYAARQALHQEATLNKEMNLPAAHRWDSTGVRIRSAGDDLLRYLLFSEEAKLDAKVRGTTTFTTDFAKRGPRDDKGRSLRDLDLEKRLFRYPCSYLIYSPSFDALPTAMREYVLQRLYNVLTGKDTHNDPRT
ncbi:MAG: hypothetical protein U0736_17055 [Gemmataceae bacterium]